MGSIESLPKPRKHRKNGRKQALPRGGRSSEQCSSGYLIRYLYSGYKEASYADRTHYGRYILVNQDTIATMSCLDSGKTKVDASFGEILVTAEKLKWVIQHGEKALRPEKRPTNFLMMYKQNEVRWEPLGVVAACVSWKYVQPPLKTADGMLTASAILYDPGPFLPMPKFVLTTPSSIT